MQAAVTNNPSSAESWTALGTLFSAEGRAELESDRGKLAMTLDCAAGVPTIVIRVEFPCDNEERDIDRCRFFLEDLPELLRLCAQILQREMRQVGARPANSRG